MSDRRLFVKGALMLSGALVGLEARESGYLIAPKVEKIGDRAALLQQKLGAIHGQKNGTGLLPPGCVGVQMGARKIFLAGKARGPRLGGELMPVEAIESFGQGLVECRLEVQGG